MRSRLPPSPRLDQLLDEEAYLGLRADPSDDGYSEFLDPADFVHETSGVVGLFSMDGKPFKECGRFLVKQIDVDSARAERVSAYDVFDLTANTWAYYEDLFDPKTDDWAQPVLRTLGCEDEYVPSSMLIIDRLELSPEFRGMGIGLRAMAALLMRYRVGAGIAAIKPFPLQFESDAGEDTDALRARGFQEYPTNLRACTRQLQAHYRRLGFKTIAKTPFMCLPLIGSLRFNA